MVTRRKFVGATGVTIASIGIAGCAGNNEGGDGETEGTEFETDGVGDSNGGTEGSNGGTEGTMDGSDGEFDLSAVDGNLGDDVSDNVEVIEHRAFRITDDDGPRDADDVGVTGVIQNTSGQPLEFVKVEVELNDGDTPIGQFVDTSDEAIDSLGAGEQWRFWVTFDDEEIGPETSYTINVESEVAEGGTGDGTATGASSGGGTTTES